MSDEGQTIEVTGEATLEETDEPTAYVSAGTVYIPVALLSDAGEITVTVTTTVTIRIGPAASAPAGAPAAPPESGVTTTPGARTYLGGSR